MSNEASQERVVLKLSKPISVGSETIENLEFREMVAKDIRGMKLPPSTDDLLNLGGKLCGQPPSVIDKLPARDTMRMLEIVGNFMGDGPATGSEV